MQIIFQNDEDYEIVNKINERLKNRELGKIVKISAEHSEILVTINKLGRSTLTFAATNHAENSRKWSLNKEKIALTHRPFKGDVLAKIKVIITQVGGKIL